jgi:nucleotide-binding universal stress UspA family protein
MTLKTLAVHLDAGARSRDRLAVAVRLAVRFGAQVAGLFADERPQRLGTSGRRRRVAWREAATEAAASFEEKLRDAGLRSAWWQVDEAEPDPGGVAGRYCRYADLAIVGQHDPEDPRVPADFAAKVMLDSGRPVMVVPWNWTHPDVGRRIVLAWDGTREAARALTDALPLLALAERVHVAMLTRDGQRVGRTRGPGPRIAHHLDAHGIAAQYQAVLVDGRRRPERAARDAILNFGAEVGADLVVMGARGRRGAFPRAGRRTRESLATMTAPVLFSA